MVEIPRKPSLTKVMLSDQKSFGTNLWNWWNFADIKFDWYFSNHFELFYYSHVHLENQVMKSYFTHYSCAVIILFNTDLYRSAFSTISLENKFFIFMCFLWFLCFESNVLNKTLKYVLLSYVISLCNFVI